MNIFKPIAIFVMLINKYYRHYYYMHTFEKIYILILHVSAAIAVSYIV